MNIENLKEQLALCKERVISQEAQNREFTTKATGIIAFATGIIAFSSRATNEANIPYVAMMVCYGIVAFLALLMVIRPVNWATPCKLSASEADARDDDCDRDKFLLKVALTHRKATEKNQKALDSKVNVLDYMIWAALAELGCAIWILASAQGSGAA